MVIFALLLVACEYPGVTHPLASAQTEKAPQRAEASQRAQPPQSKDGQVGKLAEGPARVTQRDFKLVPDTLTVKAGAVAFLLNNEGRYTHDFRVEGQGVDQKAPKVGSGRTLEWRITLQQPGTYRISCPISNHADRGMVGTLTVVQ